MLHNHILYYIATNLKVNPFIKKNYNTERRIVIVL